MNKIINDVLILDTISRRQLKKEGELKLSINGYKGTVYYDPVLKVYKWSDNEYKESLVVVKAGVKVVRMKPKEFIERFGNDSDVNIDYSIHGQKNFDRVC